MLSYTSENGRFCQVPIFEILGFSRAAGFYIPPKKSTLVNNMQQFPRFSMLYKLKIKVFLRSDKSDNIQSCCRMRSFRV